MKTIYLYITDWDDDIEGETQGIFEIVDSKLILIGWTDMYDAKLNHEYHSPIFKKLDIDLQYLPKDKYRKEAVKLLKEATGL